MEAAFISIIVVLILIAVVLGGGAMTGSFTGIFTGHDNMSANHDNAPDKPDMSGFNMNIKTNNKPQQPEPKNNSEDESSEENASETIKITGFSGSGSTSHSNNAGSTQSPPESTEEPEETYATFSISPSETSISNGSEFTIDVDIDTNTGLYAYYVEIIYDDSILYAESTENSGKFLASDAEKPIKNTIGDGKIIFSDTRIGAQDGVTGKGTLFTITFRAISLGNSTITFGKADAGIISGNTIEKPDKTETNGGIVYVS